MPPTIFLEGEGLITNCITKTTKIRNYRTKAHKTSIPLRQFYKMRQNNIVTKTNEEASSETDSNMTDDLTEGVELGVEVLTGMDDTSWKKYHTYDLLVDESQDDRASQIKLCSFKRPHMRAFHFAWWSYHVAFLMWFSITPLLYEVQQSLQIDKEQIWSSSIAAVSGTIVMRFILGPFCDKFGSRIPMGIILLISAIPTALTGLVNSVTGLCVLRFFIGIGGSTFVMCQYWTSSMFTKEWVGTANATVGGWGNLGGGITQILMGSILFPIFKNIYGGDSDKAWRTVCVFPAILGFITAYCVIKCTDDSPKGNYSKLKKLKKMGNVNVAKSLIDGAMNINTWLLFAQYACCFGVEITMNNAAALYFREKFFLSTENAAAIASIFGWMNLFARGMGGFISDKANAKWKMTGRLGWQSFVLLMEGIMVIIFANCGSLPASIAVLVFFSIFVQAAEGSTYGIVPYVNPKVTGSISGIIGAGGNVGSVVFSLCFRQLDAKVAFMIMGSMIIFTSFLSIFIFIPGHPGMFFRRQQETECTDLKSIEAAEKDAVEGYDSSVNSPAKTLNNSMDSSFDSDGSFENNNNRIPNA